MQKKIYIPIYGRNLFICDNFEEQKPPQEDKETLAAVWDENGEIFFTFKKCIDFGGGALAHECLHIAHRVFKICGVKSDEDNDEHTAYLLAWIYREVLPFCIADLLPTTGYEKGKKRSTFLEFSYPVNIQNNKGKGKKNGTF